MSANHARATQQPEHLPRELGVERVLDAKRPGRVLLPAVVGAGIPLLLYFLANRIWLRVAGRPASGIAGSGVPDLPRVEVYEKVEDWD